MPSGPITSWKIDGEIVKTVTELILGGSKITADGDCSHEVKKLSLEEKLWWTNLESILRSRDNPLPTEVCLVKAMVFSSSHVWMWELDYKESWALKHWCFWTVELEKTLESPLGSKEIQPVNPKRNESWIFIGRTDAEAEASVLWSPDAKNCLEKSLMLGRIEGRGGDDRGWDCWMASLTQWTRVWANSGSWWWTGKPGMLQSMGLQRVRHNCVTELTEEIISIFKYSFFFSLSLIFGF